MTDWSDWHDRLRKHWTAGEFSHAAATVRKALLDGIPSHQVQLLGRWIADVDASTAAWPRLRIAILRTWTVEPYLALLRARMFAEQVLLDIHLGGFGRIEQEIHESAIPFEECKAILVLWRIEDVSPQLTTDFLRTESPAAEADRLADRFRTIIESIRSRTSAYVVLGRAFLARLPLLGIADALAEAGQSEMLDRCNARLAEAARHDGSVVLIDEERWLADASVRFEPLTWTTARLPYSWPALDALACAHAAALRAIAGKVRKCIVVDLDNTLWKGIVGDEGVEGIVIDHEGEGLAFLDLHRYLRSLKDRGVLLAIASKNDRDVALNAIRTHPNCLLREADFAAAEIHWEDKAGSLRRIASLLSLGLDALVYVDDSDFECALVEAELLEVMTIRASNPYAVIATLERLRPFDALTFTREDAMRADAYRAQTARESLRTSVTSLDDFLRGLDMTVEHEVIAAGHPKWGRAVQLINKTNQFNLTGQRLSPDELRSREVHVFNVQDRFGDNGLVSAVVVDYSGSTAVIVSFVMSCRVIGRRIEQIIAAVIAAAASLRGAKELRGTYRRTERNGLVSDLYARLGFTAVEGSDDGTTWSLALPAELRLPDAIRVVQLATHG